MKRSVIADAVPTLTDIERMIEQEIGKFVMGARPLSDYPKFLNELNAAGMEKWIEAYTKEYNAVKN